MLTHPFLSYFTPNSSGISVGSTYIQDLATCHTPLPPSGPSFPHASPRGHDSLLGGLLLPPLPTPRSTQKPEWSSENVSQAVSLVCSRPTQGSPSTQSKSHSPYSVYKVLCDLGPLSLLWPHVFLLFPWTTLLQAAWGPITLLLYGLCTG